MEQASIFLPSVLPIFIKHLALMINLDLLEKMFYYDYFIFILILK